MKHHFSKILRSAACFLIVMTMIMSCMMVLALAVDNEADGIIANESDASVVPNVGFEFPEAYPISANEPTAVGAVDNAKWYDNDLESVEAKTAITVVGGFVKEFRYGDVITFAIDVPVAGLYEICLNHIWIFAATWDLSVDGEEVIPISLEPSADWNNAFDAYVGDFEFTAGTHTFEFTYTKEDSGDHIGALLVTPLDVVDPPAQDTTASDAEETTVSDTTAEDITAADTTAEDTTAEDTTVSDTTVAAVEDTTVDDSSTNAPEEGTASADATAEATNAAEASGCGASVGAVAATAALIAVAGAVALKKKED